MHHTLLHETEHCVLSSHSVLLNIVELDCQLVFQLAFLSQKVCVVPVVKVSLVLGQRIHLEVLNPVDVAVSSQGLQFHLHEFSSSQQAQSADLILESPPVPHSGNP